MGSVWKGLIQNLKNYALHGMKSKKIIHFTMITFRVYFWLIDGLD